LKDSRSNFNESPYKGVKRGMSPAKEQYQDFKLKHRIISEKDADIHLSPEARKCKPIFLSPSP
jgi:hypothetical protein